MEKIDYIAQGKANRKKGAAFELKVRKHYENGGYGDGYLDVMKCQNNIDLDSGKWVKAKQKFIRGRGMGLGSGFPDFMIFTPKRVFFVECKTNGTLSKIEKLKCNAILKMGYGVWVAYQDGKEIGFREFVEYKERNVVRRK